MDLRKDDEQTYLVVVDTRMVSSLETIYPKHVYISFDLSIDRSPHFLERGLALGMINRSYSLMLPEDHDFLPGSRRLFLVTSNVPLEHAHRLRCWVNYDGLDVVWRPEKIMVAMPKNRDLRTLPSFGCINVSFNMVNEFHLSGDLSLTSDNNELNAVRNWFKN